MNSTLKSIIVRPYSVLLPPFFNIFLVILFFCIHHKSSTAQNQSGGAVSFLTGNTYIGSYHIKCNGDNTGVLEANPTFGTAPYTFLWNTGETVAKLTNKPAGTYIVTATDANNITRKDTLILRQPYALNYQSTISNFNGYNIEAAGGNRGYIQLAASGGTPAYRILWNNGDSAITRSSLSASTYTFVITDANQCTTNGSITLTEPNPIQVNFSNIENPHCFKSADGKATINISGGLGDFRVVWDNGSFSFSPDDLKDGYNAVRIYERDRAVLDTGITLTSPDALDIQFTYSQYSGYNVSCVDCFNGTVATTVTGGTTPYTYQWEDANNSITANLSNLNGGDITINITDANGCKTSNTAQLTMPTPKDWSRYGNANIDTAQFIGSTDSSAVVFKSNNQEALRIAGNGTLIVNNNLQLKQYELSTSNGIQRAAVFNDQGILVPVLGGQINLNEENPDPQYHPGCELNIPFYPWQNPSVYSNSTNTLISTDNTSIVTCPSVRVGIGVSKPHIMANFDVAGSAMVRGGFSVGYAAPVTSGIKVNGDMLVNGKGYISENLGIGTSTPSQKLEIKHNDPTGGISITKVSTDLGSKSEIKFNKNTQQLSAIGCDMDDNGKNTFYIWQNNSLPIPFIINAIGKVGIGGV